MWQFTPAPFSATLQSAPSGRAGAYHTVRTMRALVKRAKTSEPMISLARSLAARAQEFHQAGEADQIFSYVRDRIRYMRDVLDVETLADPRATAKQGCGDCDDKSTLLATLLEAVGYPTRFVMARYDSSDFEHVYLQVYLNGQWVDADATLHAPLGSAPPNPSELWFETV